MKFTSGVKFAAADMLPGIAPFLPLLRDICVLRIGEQAKTRAKFGEIYIAVSQRI